MKIVVHYRCESQLPERRPTGMPSARANRGYSTTILGGQVMVLQTNYATPLFRKTVQNKVRVVKIVDAVYGKM